MSYPLSARLVRNHDNPHRQVSPIKPLILGMCLSFLAQPLAAQVTGDYAPGAQRPIKLHRLAQPIQLDGLVDEPAWRAVDPFPLVMYQPTYKGAMTEHTEIRVAYDDDHLYVSGKLYHVVSENLRANSFYRDRWSGDETFAIVLDTFNDNENALWFYTTPLGTRFDIAVADDAANGRDSNNYNWNTFWDVATTRTNEGWFAEIRIPFSSLGFQDEDGRVEMGMIVYRWMGHNNHRYIFPDIPPRWERGSNKPSVAQDVILEGVYSRKPVYVTPYGLGGVQRKSELSPSKTDYRFNDDFMREIGLDVKYNLTNNLTLDATVNTDFAQVEADDQQINLTRFSLFFPEKRQFFQERSGIFEFDTGASGSRLFHSRRIGLVDGQPIRILGGSRLVGRVGEWDIGLLNMQTAKEGDVPTENFGVLRLRRRVFNAFSTIGGLATSRIDVDGGYNLAYGLDGIVRITGDEYFTAKWAQTLDKNQLDAGAFSFLDAGRFMLKWERRIIQGLSYELEAVRTGADYNPAVGFVRRRDVFVLSPDVNYQTFRGADSRFRRIWVGNWSNIYLRNEDGSVESAWLHPFYWFETKGGATLLLSTAHTYEDVRTSFPLSTEVLVPIGPYWFHDLWVEANPPDRWFFRPDVTFRTGTFYDGWKTTLRTGATWNLSRHLELRGIYELNLIRFSGRDQQLDTHLGQIRIQTALNTHFSATVFLQYNSVADVFIVNTRIRYHFGEGNDLWLVFNEGFNTERHQSFGPMLPVTDSRAILLKYTYTFIW